MTNDTNKLIHGLGLSFNAREVPTPPPAPHEAAANDKANEVIQNSVLARPVKSYPMSTGRQDTLPAFKVHGENLDRDMLKVRLGDSVRLGTLNEQQAAEIWRSIYGDEQP